MDLSKAHDCLSHDLIIVKFEAMVLIKVAWNCSTGIFQIESKVKKGSALSEWIDFLTEISQGSIFCSLIFNILINDLIMFTVWIFTQI